jgi:hypothetical protein
LARNIDKARKVIEKTRNKVTEKLEDFTQSASQISFGRDGLLIVLLGLIHVGYPEHMAAHLAEDDMCGSFIVQPKIGQVLAE